RLATSLFHRVKLWRRHSCLPWWLVGQTIVFCGLPFNGRTPGERQTTKTDRPPHCSHAVLPLLLACSQSGLHGPVIHIRRDLGKLEGRTDPVSMPSFFRPTPNVVAVKMSPW